MQLEPVNRRRLNQVQPEQVEVETFRVEQPQENGVEESELDEIWIKLIPSLKGRAAAIPPTPRVDVSNSRLL